MKNFWDEFEYSKLKLLNSNNKVKSILDVYQGHKDYDEQFPISIDLHLTNACNLNCSWCTDSEIRKGAATMDFQKALQLIDEFAEHNTGVTLEGGGEPTLHKNFSEIADYAYRKNVSIGLITNGTVDVSNDVYKFKWVRVSLDACNAEEYTKEKGKDSFQKVITNLQEFSLKRNPEKTYLGVGYVITKRNMENLQGLVDLLDSIGVDYIYFRPVEEAPDILPSVSEMINLKRDLVEWTEGKRIKYLINIYDRVTKNNHNLPCVAHSLTSIVHADGSVNLCEKRRHDEICLGNINEMSFAEIWNSDMRKFATNKLLCSECQEGCDVCRVTGFNEIFHHLIHMNTKNFI